MHDPKQLIKDLEASRIQIEHEKAKSDALFTSMGDGAVATDEDGRISRINKAALDILGYDDPYELLGKWYPKTIIAEDEEGNIIPSINRPITRAFLTGLPVSDRIIFHRKDGSLVNVSLTVSPIILENEPIGAIQVLRDITEEIAVERAKDEFISLTSHQLRTPLTSIRLFSELLSDNSTGALSPIQKDYLSKISNSTERMILLVGDILNVSRIELGRIQIQPKLIDVTKLIAGRIDELEPIAKEKGIAMKFKKPRPSLPDIKLDPSLIGQVIHNLLANALRYTDKKRGKIEVELLRAGNKCQITVRDNGIGIPDNVRARVFDRFFRAENARSVAAEGTGLGLYLVKMIVELAGGKIWFDSNIGEGTTFFVTLPMRGMKKKSTGKVLAGIDS